MITACRFEPVETHSSSEYALNIVGFYLNHLNKHWTTAWRNAINITANTSKFSNILNVLSVQMVNAFVQRTNVTNNPPIHISGLHCYDGAPS